MNKKCIYIVIRNYDITNQQYSNNYNNAFLNDNILILFHH